MNQFQAVAAYELLEVPLTARAAARASIRKAVLFWGVTLGWWRPLDGTVSNPETGPEQQGE